MKEAGVTRSSDFGVYLNDFSKPSPRWPGESTSLGTSLPGLICSAGGPPGPIAFGGVDKAKFTGELQAVPPLANDQGRFPELVVNFISVALVRGTGQNGTANKLSPANLLKDTQPALLDTGNPEIDLPTDTAREMAQEQGVETRTDKNAVLLGDVPCSLASMSMVFGFDDDATKVKVPLDLLMTPGATTGQCSIPSIIGVENGVVGGLTSLGNPFLQASYAVFDTEGKEFLLGQAIMNVTESELVEYTG